MGDAKVVYASKLPNCDICGVDARYYALTKIGIRANLCQYDWTKFGIGLGKRKGNLIIKQFKTKK
jgi:hypothetical protein